MAKSSAKLMVWSGARLENQRLCIYVKAAKRKPPSQRNTPCGYPKLQFQRHEYRAARAKRVPWKADSLLWEWPFSHWIAPSWPELEVSGWYAQIVQDFFNPGALLGSGDTLFAFFTTGNQAASAGRWSKGFMKFWKISLKFRCWGHVSGQRIPRHHCQIRVPERALECKFDCEEDGSGVASEGRRVSVFCTSGRLRARLQLSPVRL